MARSGDRLGYSPDRRNLRPQMADKSWKIPEWGLWVGKESQARRDHEP